MDEKVKEIMISIKRRTKLTSFTSEKPVTYLGFELQLLLLLFEKEKEIESKNRIIEAYVDKKLELQARIEEMEKEKREMVRLSREDMKKLGWSSTY